MEFNIKDLEDREKLKKLFRVTPLDQFLYDFYNLPREALDYAEATGWAEETKRSLLKTRISELDRTEADSRIEKQLHIADRSAVAAQAAAWAAGIIAFLTFLQMPRGQTPLIT